MTESTNTIHAYLAKPYARLMIHDSDTNTYTAKIREFPGCVAQGDSVAQAWDKLEKAAESWIRSCIDAGRSIPQPIASQAYSGKIMLRLPRSLHREAAEMAERDTVSLNQFLVDAIAEKTGFSRAVQQRSTAANLVILHTSIHIIKLPKATARILVMVTGFLNSRL